MGNYRDESRGETRGGWTRREFLKGASLAAVTLASGVALDRWESLAEASEGELRKRTLGRTGLKVTVVSYGGLKTQDRRILDAAIDRGINLIHTSPGYLRGRSIQVFGEVMKTKRDKVYLALKAAPERGIDQHLRTLNTDRVDILVPPAHSVREIRNPRWPEAFAALKRAGKIRFAGFACHKNQAAVMREAIKLGFFDVMLVAYNLSNREELNPLLEQAKKQHNMGFMVMKAMQGVDRRRPEVVAAAQKSLLANPNVDTLLIGMGTFQEVQRNLELARQRMSRQEEELLERYLTAAGPLCSLCGACEVCPRGVAVGEIMRAHHYLERGDGDLAVALYARLPASCTAATCDECGLCEQACPRGLPVVETLRRTHRALV